MGFETTNDAPLPYGWRWATLEEVCGKPQYGWTTSASERGGLKFLRTTDISSGTVAWDHVPYCSEAPDNIERFLVADGDIVVSRAGSVGKSFLIRQPERAVFASYLVRLRPRIDAKYVAYFMQSAAYWTQIADASSGIAIPNVNASKLAQVRLPLPPDDQIEPLVERIGELFGEIEAGEQELAAAKSDLARYHRAVLKAAVTGELTRDWREQNPPPETGAALLARILAEPRARQPYLSAHKASELPPLPTGWAWATMDQLASLVTSGSRGWAERYAASGALFIRAQNINTDRLILDDIAHVQPPDGMEGARTKVAEHDLLITITGANVTKAAIVDVDLDEAYVSQHVALTRPVIAALAPYLHAFLLDESSGRGQLLSAAYGAGKPGLNLTNIRELLVPLPPLEEQAAITAKLSRLISATDDLRSEIASASVTAIRVRQSILASAFRGDLTRSPNIPLLDAL